MDSISLLFADEDGGRGDGIDVRWMMEDRDVIKAVEDYTISNLSLTR